MSTFLSCIDYLTACVYTKGIKRFEGGTYMDKNVSKEVKRIIICCIASCIIAVNIRTVVRTGGLCPGGANGLTLLIQSIFWPLSSYNNTLYCYPRSSECHSCLYRFSLYRQKIHALFLSCHIPHRFSDRQSAGLHHHLRYSADQYFRRSDQRFRYQPLSEMWCHHRRNGFYLHFPVPQKGHWCL